MGLYFFLFVLTPLSRDVPHQSSSWLWSINAPGSSAQPWAATAPVTLFLLHNTCLLSRCSVPCPARSDELPRDFLSFRGQMGDTDHFPPPPLSSYRRYPALLINAPEVSRVLHSVPSDSAFDLMEVNHSWSLLFSSFLFYLFVGMILDTGLFPSFVSLTSALRRLSPLLHSPRSFLWALLALEPLVSSIIRDWALTASPPSLGNFHTHPLFTSPLSASLCLGQLSRSFFHSQPLHPFHYCAIELSSPTSLSRPAFSQGSA